MRRSLAAFAAAALLLSTVGGAIGAEPDASASPAPIVEPTPDPSPAADPAPSAEPQPSDPGPSLAPDPVPSDPALDPAVASQPPDGAPAPIVAATIPAGVTPARAQGAATDPTDRWIVVLKPGTDADAAAVRQGRRIGFSTDRTYRNALRGYAAKLDRARVTALSHDPSVEMIVPDERIETEAQALPTGISRVNATKSTVAKIDGMDERVDADVAIVDTGIAPTVPDLNVAGGYNCSTHDRAAWRDVDGHGTHVAGTVGAIDNGIGVVGVAPGVRLWAVKILNDAGYGLLTRWYVCGLDWIARPARPRRRVPAAVRGGQHERREVGQGRRATAASRTSDVLHAAICRLVASGVTVVAAAGNDASQRRGPGPGRLQRGHHRVGPGGHGRQARRAGRPERCYSWGTYDSDDTFADFSNYGTDVDLIAPGKCIWSTMPGRLRLHAPGRRWQRPT